MNIRDYRTEFTERLSHLYDKQEIESFFYLIVEDLKNISKIDLALQPNLEFSEKEYQKINFYLQELELQKPIQYILGWSHFLGLKLNVNSNVLIPRPETEELVEWVIKENQNKKGIRVLDIGTGSGAIAISLAKKLKAEITAFDISEAALDTAQNNADLNKVFIHFIEFDILNDKWDGEQFNVIVSNPPYVRELEKQQIKPNVIENEPHLALFVPDDNPLVFYEKIADFALEHLSLDGQLFLEINQYLGIETVTMLQNKGFKSVTLQRDVYGNDRMILAQQ